MKRRISIYVYLYDVNSLNLHPYIFESRFSNLGKTVQTFDDTKKNVRLGTYRYIVFSSLSLSLSLRSPIHTQQRGGGRHKVPSIFARRINTRQAKLNRAGSRPANRMQSTENIFPARNMRRLFSRAQKAAYTHTHDSIFLSFFLSSVAAEAAAAVSKAWNGIEEDEKNVKLSLQSLPLRIYRFHIPIYIFLLFFLLF